MNNKSMMLIVLITGMGIGAMGTYQLIKRKYEKIVQEEISSIKETWGLKEKKKASAPEEDIKEKENRTEATKEYNAILKENRYTNYFNSSEDKKGDNSLEKPYIISPEEFGEFEEYEKVSLTYFADQVLTDENDDEVEDVETVVGVESLSHFGEYEDDSVFVRNDRLKCDYEILLDQRCYTDIAPKYAPHKAEE